MGIWSFCQMHSYSKLSLLHSPFLSSSLSLGQLCSKQLTFFLSFIPTFLMLIKASPLLESSSSRWVAKGVMKEMRISSSLTADHLSWFRVAGWVNSETWLISSPSAVVAREGTQTRICGTHRRLLLSVPMINSCVKKSRHFTYLKNNFSHNILIMFLLPHLLPDHPPHSYSPTLCFLFLFQKKKQNKQKPEIQRTLNHQWLQIDLILAYFFKYIFD